MKDLPKNHYLIIISASFLLVSGILYDLVFQPHPCLLCTLQRYVLGFIILTTLLNLPLIWRKIPFILGLLLTIRHAYVLLFPQQVTSCLPFDLLLKLPLSSFLQAFMTYLSQLGHGCSTQVDPITYLLVPLLFIYYVILLVADDIIK